MRNHGTQPEHRWAVMRERVLALRAIWENDEAEFHGAHVDFDPIWSWPKPAQVRLPILIGGAGPNALRRVVEIADGWIPPAYWVDDLAARIAELRTRADDAGRSMPSVTVIGATPDRESMDRFEAIGVDRAVINMPTANADESFTLLDQWAKLLD
jgi:alkanesulfonate monooxygenase SsuD/methylene tetrahydromethanopterin reductase-like flavin-dependent oxidoreductase (luciferase family)